MNRSTPHRSSSPYRLAHASAKGGINECRVAFQNAIGSAIQNGPLRDKYNALGGLAPGGTSLGYLTEDHNRALPDGQGQGARFENGVIYWSPATGAHEVTGVPLLLWAASGYEASQFGYPTGSEFYDVNEELTQPFQKKVLNASTEITAFGDELYQGKLINSWLLEQARKYAQGQGFDLDEDWTPLPSTGESNRGQAENQRVAPGSAPFPDNPNTGGIEIPDDYYYSGVTGDTLHEFCTKSPDEFPSPGANTNFRGACAQHDMCYEAVEPDAAGMRTCDSDFRNNLLRVCEGVYTGFIDKLRRDSCSSTAIGYYSAVVAAHHDNY